MKYLFAIIIVGICGYLYFNNTSKKVGHVCKLENNNIITIGDSLANGFGVNENDSFAIKIPKLLNKNPLKRGINGETSSELLGRIDSELKSTSKIAAVIISIGGNDFLRKIDENTTKRNIDLIVQKTKNYTNCIILLGVPNGIMDGITGGSSPIYKDITNKYKILLDNKSMAKILKNANLKVDQIHPNKNGHEIITNNIVNLIKKNK